MWRSSTSHVAKREIGHEDHEVDHDLVSPVDRADPPHTARKQFTLDERDHRGHAEIGHGTCKYQ